MLTFSLSESGTIQQWLDFTLQGNCGNTVTISEIYRRIIFDGVIMSVTLGDVEADNRTAIGSALPLDLSVVSIAVDIELDGENRLLGGTDSAGLYVASDSSVVLKDQNGDGSLYAQGGQAGNPKQSGSGAGSGS